MVSGEQGIEQIDPIMSTEKVDGRILVRLDQVDCMRYNEDEKAEGGIISAQNKTVIKE